MGDFQPDAQVNGFAGSNLIALLCNKYCVIKLNVVVMSQGYKIYYDDRFIVLSSKITKSFEKNDGLFLKYGKKTELIELLHAFENFTHIQSLYIFSDSEDALLEMIKSTYTIVEAAGGVVKRADGKMLAIYRQGKWDLPKGKIEKGEFYKQAALREVQEECGLKKLEVAKKIGDTYHVYDHKGGRVLKRTVWYEMELTSEETPVVETAEGITDYLWFDYQNASEIMKNTYESLKDLFLIQINPD